MLQLNNLQKLTKKRKRIGRNGGRGGTSGRGETGQGSRTGANSKIGHTFEGGQMPLVRRIPRRGFNNIHQDDFRIVNVSELEARFESGSVVSEDMLFEAGIIKNARKCKIKLLAKGTLTKSITVTVHKASKAAMDAVVNAGGKVLINEEK